MSMVAKAAEGVGGSVAPAERAEAVDAGAFGAGSPAEAALEALAAAERESAQLALRLERGRVLSARRDNAGLRASLAAARAEAARARRDAGDALAHRTRELARRDAALAELEGRYRVASATAAQKDGAIDCLRGELSAARARLDDSADLLGDRQALEDTVRRQDDVILRQREELVRLRELVERTDARLLETEEEASDLRAMAQATTRLAYLFGGAPWLVRTERRRLRGDAPRDRAEGTLTAVGRRLVLVGGECATTGTGASAPVPVGGGGDTHCLDLDAMAWTLVPAQACRGAGAARAGHAAAVGAKGRLVVVGGRAVEAPAAAAARASEKLESAADAGDSGGVGDDGSGDAPTSASAGGAPTHRADAAVMDLDALRWGAPRLSPQGVAAAREGAAACAVRGRCYAFGGWDARAQCLTADLLRLDFSEAEAWATVPTRGAAPPPRRDHALCAAQDGRRLWLFGGRGGNGGALADLHVLHLDMAVPSWQHLAQPSGARWPSAREGASVGFVDGRHLVLAGGQDGQGALEDAWVMDTETLEWVPLEDAASEGVPTTPVTPSAASRADSPSLRRPRGAAQAARPGGGAPRAGQASVLSASGLTHAPYRAMVGRRLYALHSSGPDQLLSELTWMELTPPDELEALRPARSDAARASDRPELADEVAATAHTLEVAWGVPQRSADLVDHCKLLMASTGGVVREVCSGRMSKHTVTGLRANTEYIFSVKVVYVDGLCRWSESKAYRTRM